MKDVKILFIAIEIILLFVGTLCGICSLLKPAIIFAVWAIILMLVYMLYDMIYEVTFKDKKEN